jgi:quinol monooxygenase YgiN
VIVIAKLEAKKGMENKMETILKGIISDVDKEKDTLVYTLNKSQNNPSIFLFYEKYKNADALFAHSSSPYFKKLIKDLEPVLEKEPEIDLYEEIDKINSK